MQVKQRYFRTSALNLAVFLHTKELQLIGIESTPGSSKKEFAFVQTAELDELVGKYRFGSWDDPDLLIPVRRYENARNELLDRLNGH